MNHYFRHYFKFYRTCCGLLNNKTWWRTWWSLPWGHNSKLNPPWNQPLLSERHTTVALLCLGQPLNLCIPGVPQKMTQLYNVISTKILNLRSSNFLQWFRWNSVLKNLMWLPHAIEILLIFENQQNLSPVTISKITGKVLLDIR